MIKIILNNADNIMYGNKEVDRVFYGKHLVWERGYKWINDINNNIIGYRNKKRPYGTIYLNWCEKPYTVTKPVILSKWSTSVAEEYYEYYTLSPIKGYNIFGDKIEKTNSVWLDEEYQITQTNKPNDFFNDVDLIINNGKCTQISDFAFSLRSLSSITFPDNGVSYSKDGCSTGYTLSYIGNYAFYKTKVKTPDCLCLLPIKTSWGGQGAFNIVPYIGEMAFAFSNVITELFIDCRFIECQAVIDEMAFYNCNSITSLYFLTSLNGCIEVKENAFQHCGNLSEFVFENKDSTTSGRLHNIKINSLAFSFCPSLNVIDFKFANCTIETDAFKGSSLSELIFRGSTIIKKDAFSQCENLKTIYLCQGVRTDFEQDAFRTQVFYNCKFIVGHNNIKTALINSGVPESLIIIDNEYKY